MIENLPVKIICNIAKIIIIGIINTTELKPAVFQKKLEIADLVDQSFCRN